MTQLVFIHGVATRSGEEYENAVEIRNALFSRVLFQEASLGVHTPLWGDLVPDIEKRVYDTGKVATAFALGGVGGATGNGMGIAVGGGGAGAQVSDSTLSLSGLARTNPAVALDALYVELLERYEREGKPVPAAEMEGFAQAAKAISADIMAGDSQVPVNGTRALIGGALSDDALGRALIDKIGGPASYGLLSGIGSAIDAVTGRVRNIASRIAVDPIVDLIRPAVGFFLGDVFAYLDNGALREEIRARVREKLLEAHTARAPGEKLVVVGHSLGGVVVVDMLCAPDRAGLPGDFQVDAMLTVGSQAGLFQSLGLLVDPPGGLVPRPTCVSSWFNVFDPLDPLAFRCDPIFAGVRDMRFDSITGVASAHTTYFKRPQFYARARIRLLEIGVIT